MGDELLKIEGIHSLEQIELYSRALRAPDHSLNLILPTNIKHAHLGATSSLIQIVVTWAQRCPNGSLLIYSNESQKIAPELDNLSRTQHGLVALLSAPAVKTSQKTLRQDCTPEAKAIALSTLRDADASEFGLRNGPELLLIAADDTIYAAPRKLYSRPPDSYPLPHGYADFLNLSTAMIRNLSSLYLRSEPVDEALTDHLSTLLYELFKNTHMWARNNLANIPIERSVRGMRLEFSLATDLTQHQLSPWHRNYLSTLAEGATVEGFLELAVFDSGPGLAARMLNRPLVEQDSLESEYSSVMKCLSLHASTSAHDHHGGGLADVMKAISEANGFIRIRSGRLALFRDFSSTAMRSFDDLYLNDWDSGSDTLLNHGSLEGTLVSVLLPVMRRRS